MYQDHKLLLYVLAHFLFLARLFLSFPQSIRVSLALMLTLLNLFHLMRCPAVLCLCELLLVPVVCEIESECFEEYLLAELFPE